MSKNYNLEDTENLTTTQHNMEVQPQVMDVSDMVSNSTNNLPTHIGNVENIRHFLALPEDKREVHGYKFDNLDLRRIDITGLNFSNCSFYRTKLGRNNLKHLLSSPLDSKISLAGIDMSNEDLSHQYLNKLGLIAFIPVKAKDLDLTDADFSNANLSGMKFHNCNLTNVNFSGCQLTDAQIEESNIDHANFRKTNVVADQLKTNENYQTAKYDNIAIIDAITKLLNQQPSALEKAFKNIFSTLNSMAKSTFANMFLDNDLRTLGFFKLLPVENLNTPVSSKTLRVEDKKAPVLSETLPVEDKEALVLSETLPVEDKEAPVLSETLPVEDKEAPVLSETLPVEDKEATVLSETLPVEDKEAPVLSETLPVEDKEATVLSETLPVEDKEATVLSETLPVEDNKAPIGPHTAKLLKEKPQQSSSRDL